MTNATKTLSLIFAISLGLLLLQLLLGSGGQSEIFRDRLVEADPAEVNRFTLEHPPDTSFVELLKTNGTWQVQANNETFEADSQKIETALQELTEMQVEALVTRDPEKHSRYRVDSTGTFITLFEDDSQSGQLIVSSAQAPGGSGDIYVRVPGDDRVFSVSGLRRSSIQSNYNNWRDLTVWNLPADSITEIRFQYPADSSFTMRKENGSWLAGADTLDEQKTSTLTNMLADLDVSGYPPEEMEQIDSEPTYTIDFSLNDGETKTLAFYRFVDAEPAPLYKVRASGYPYTFTLAKRTWDQSVLRSREEFLRE